MLPEEQDASQLVSSAEAEVGGGSSQYQADAEVANGSLNRSEESQESGLVLQTQMPVSQSTFGWESSMVVE